MVYNSITMQQAGENTDACEFNDLALIKSTRPTSARSTAIPFWGGPTGRATAPPTARRSYTTGTRHCALVSAS